MRDPMVYVAFQRRFNPDALRAAREKLGLTQVDLSKLLYPYSKSFEVSCRYENGKHKPSPTTLKKLCDILGVGMDVLAPKTERL